MAVYETYSKRQKRLRGIVEDVYEYDDIPEKLRVQIIHILYQTIGHDQLGLQQEISDAYRLLVNTLRKEYGVLILPPSTRHSPGYKEEFLGFFLDGELDQALDVIELGFRYIDKVIRQDNHIHVFGSGQRVADEAISELNYRFKENSVGYQYVDGEVIRVDSELLHVEAVKPALKLLNARAYKGPQEEFLSAFDHYRSGKNKEALTDCLKAFESTMKAICDKRVWTYNSGDNAKTLIGIMFSNKLIPSFWQSQFTALRSSLESSIPTGRNNLSGHGHGSVPTDVPDEIAAYMLHMTASTLVFLTTAEQKLP